MFWIVLYFLVAAFILGVFFWTIRILVQQKAAWSKFAQRHGFTYERGRMMASPGVRSDEPPFIFFFYAEEKPTDDGRGTTFRTIVQACWDSEAGFEFAVGTGALKDTIRSMSRGAMINSKEAFDFPDGMSVASRSSDSERARAYMTPERRKALGAFFRQKNADGILVFDEKTGVLRLETPDPLETVQKIERAYALIKKVSRALILKETESALRESRPDDDEKVVTS